MIDLLLLQIPSFQETPYLIGVAALKAFLAQRGFTVKSGTGIDAFENPQMLHRWKKQFSIESEAKDFIQDHEILERAWQQVKCEIEKSQPRVLGFSLLYGNIRNSYYLLARARQDFPKLPILLGGPGTISGMSSLPQRKFCTFMVHGEAEKIVSEFLKNPYCDFTKFNNISFFKDGNWIHTPRVEEEETELSALAFPDYSDFSNNEYAKTIFETTPLSLGRGCSFRCRFCTVKEYNAIYRHYDIDDCIKYIRDKAKTGVAAFMVHDPILNGNPGWTRDFCRALIREKLNIRWGGNLRLTNYLNDGETLDLLFKSGFHIVNMGIESGSESVLKHMKKFYDMQVIKEIFASISIYKKQFPIEFLAQLIIGYPSETEEDFQQTLQFVRDYRHVIDSINTCSAFLLLGDENYDIKTMIENKEFGLEVKSPSDWSSFNSTPKIRLQRIIEAEELFKELQLPYRMFYKKELQQIVPQFHSVAVSNSL